MDVFTFLGFLSLLAIIKAIRIYFFSPEVSPNPFAEVKVKPLKPKVIEKKAREAVLKQSFTMDKVPKNLDAIVIGSGIGGLTTAAIMGGAGKKVLVLEQHDQAGGCCHTFIEKGYEFDVGIHYIGTMEYQSPSKTLVDQITGGQLTWEPLDNTFDEVVFVEKGKAIRKYEVMAGKDNWNNYLKKSFPGEEANIDKFFGYLKEVKSSTQSSMVIKMLPLWLVKIVSALGLTSYLSNYWTWNNKTVQQVLQEVTDNQELRDIFCYCFGDYGTVPSKAGFPMQALLLNHFLDAGASYPVGGASEIAFHIIPEIEAAGGKVLVRAQVKQIICDSQGRACGVRVQKGQNEHDIMAPVVISSAGLYNTMLKLLPREISNKSSLSPLLKMPHGPTCMSGFIGLDCSADELDIIKKKNYWAFTGNDLDKITTDYLNLPVEKALETDVPLLFISFPSTKDPEWDRKYPNKTTIAIITLANYEWFRQWEKEPATRRSYDYESVKKAIGQRMVDQVTDLFPSIKDHIDYVNIGSPLSNNYYLGAMKGEIYGLDHTSERFDFINTSLLRPKTDIPGLYLSGQDVCSAGFVGGLWGGVLGAAAALERNIFNDLPGLHKAMIAMKAKNKSA